MNDTESSARRNAAVQREIDNVRAILSTFYAYPDGISLRHVELFGRSWPLAGELGGDHIIFIDFARRYDLDRRVADARAAGLDQVAVGLESCRSRVGLVLADVCGHKMTDAVVAVMLHQAFLVGVLYELAHHGHVTTELFEILNTRFCQSSALAKYITMIYGEIGDDGTFHFISAGHPRPLIYSAEFGHFVTPGPQSLIAVPPIGVFPTTGGVDSAMETGRETESPRLTVNEVRLLGEGDVLLLFTDGAAEQAGGDLAAALTPVMRSVSHLSPREIVETLAAELGRCSRAKDDVTLLAIKRRVE